MLSPLTLPLLLEAQQLLPVLKHPHLILLDATYYLPTENKNADAHFQTVRLPNAQRFDIDKIADITASLPHMLPLSAEAFEGALQALGVTLESWVVIYDQKGLFSAPRVWWMLKTFGWHNISVLQGGLPAWMKAGFPMEEGSPQLPTPTSKPLGLSFSTEKVKTLATVLTNLETRTHKILDARSVGRFEGTASEPRAGLKSGHIPDSLNLPFTQLLTDDGYLKPKADLQALFSGLNLTPTTPIICSCGSGITACVLALALKIAEHSAPVSVYDGSWMEWGASPTTPVNTLFRQD